MRLTNEEKVEIVLIVGKRGPDQDNDNNNLPVGYNEDDELNILLYLEENPKTSLRQISRDLNLKICFIRFVFKKHKIKPFKPKFTHTLLPGDADMRLDFSAWILGAME